MFRETVAADPATDADKDRFKDAAVSVMKWGGITRYDKLCELGKEALRELKENARRLDPEHADTNNLRGFKYMGAGYSKIYSLMLDDFPIYDSRVACALTSLIWIFCVEKHFQRIPEHLCLGVPNGRVGNRNPCGFPSTNGGRRYADSNLKAAWLLGTLANRGKFATLPAEHRVIALQSALFMIGYMPLKQDAIKKRRRGPLSAR